MGTREKFKTLGGRATDVLDVAPTDAPPRQKQREERGGGDEGKEGGRRDTREEGELRFGLCTFAILGVSRMKRRRGRKKTNKPPKPSSLLLLLLLLWRPPLAGGGESGQGFVHEGVPALIHML